MVQSKKSPQTNLRSEQWKQTLYIVCTSLRVVSGYHQTFRNQHTRVYPNMCNIYNINIFQIISYQILFHFCWCYMMWYYTILYILVHVLFKCYSNHTWNPDWNKKKSPSITNSETQLASCLMPSSKQTQTSEEHGTTGPRFFHFFRNAFGIITPTGCINTQ